MTASLDPKYVLRRFRNRVNLLFEIRRNYWVVGAMNDQDRCVNILNLSISSKLRDDRKLNSWKEPKHPSRHGGKRRERSLKHYSAYLRVSGQVRSYGRAKGLTKRNDRASRGVPRLGQILIRSLCIPVKTTFTWRAFTSTVAAILHRQHIGGRIVKELVYVCAIRDISSISVKRQERKLCVRRRNPPRVQLYTIRRAKPHVFHRQILRMPVSIKTARFVREENQVRLKEAGKHQNGEVSDYGNA